MAIRDGAITDVGEGAPAEPGPGLDIVGGTGITVLPGLPPRELDRVSEITPLTGPERDLVASWSAPESWLPGARHPARGKYLLKVGDRLGIPIEMSLVGAEYRLYDTDQAIRAARPAHPVVTGREQA